MGEQLSKWHMGWGWLSFDTHQYYYYFGKDQDQLIFFSLPLIVFK